MCYSDLIAVSNGCFISRLTDKELRTSTLSIRSEAALIVAEEMIITEGQKMGGGNSKLSYGHRQDSVEINFIAYLTQKCNADYMVIGSPLSRSHLV